MNDRKVTGPPADTRKVTTAGLRRMKERGEPIAALTAYDHTMAVLLDEAGTVGKTYGATRTPEMYILDKEGKVVYHGAIDDNKDMKGTGKTNYVAKALDEVIAGKPVTTAETKAYGCTVKYGK